MKYTELFFTFPIRIYDPYELERLEKEEEMLETRGSAPGFVVGLKKIPYQDITGWYDVFTRELELNDVIEHGFPCTLVQTKTEGDYLCHWKRKKFEEELDKFVEKSSLDSIKLENN